MHAFPVRDVTAMISGSEELGQAKRFIIEQTIISYVSVTQRLHSLVTTKERDDS